MKSDNKPLIGLTIHGRNEKNAFYTPAPYVESIRRAGGVPVLIPPGEQNVEILVNAFDGFLFTGGGDINPTLYSGENHSSIYGVDADRDLSELSLASKVLTLNIPTLAICRGMQLFTIATGGQLEVDISEKKINGVEHRLPGYQPSTHAVKLNKGSRLYQIIGQESISSASIHHQAVNELPKKSKSVALAPDGVIEAIEFENHPNLVLVQWHPEITAENDPVQQKLFDELIRMSKSSHKK